MRKLMYLAAANLDYEKPAGVAKKLINQFEVFRKHFSCVLVHYGTEGIVITDGEKKEVIPYKKYVHRRFQIFKIALQVCKSYECDKVYIRYPKSDLVFIRLIKRIRMLGCKIIVEIATYPYDEEKSHNNVLKDNLIPLNDKLFRRNLKKYVDRIVTFSDDKEIFGIKTINTINGISFNNTSIRQYVKHEGIIFVSCAQYHICHGCERLIEGIYNYYKSGGKEKITFIIAGRGTQIPLYKQRTMEYGLEEHILFPGFCSGSQLEELYNKADIGVNSLAIHRIGLENESTLKSKEYAAKGLPIISSSFIDAFSPEDNEKYVCRVPADESAIDINRVIDFYNKFSQISKDELADEIRKVSRKICDMENTLRPIIEIFNEEI